MRSDNYIFNPGSMSLSLSGTVNRRGPEGVPMQDTPTFAQILKLGSNYGKTSK